MKLSLRNSFFLKLIIVALLFFGGKSLLESSADIAFDRLSDGYHHPLDIYHAWENDQTETWRRLHDILNIHNNAASGRVETPEEFMQGFHPYIPFIKRDNPTDFMESVATHYPNIKQAIEAYNSAFSRLKVTYQTYYDTPSGAAKLASAHKTTEVLWEMMQASSTIANVYAKIHLEHASRYPKAGKVDLEVSQWHLAIAPPVYATSEAFFALAQTGDIEAYQAKMAELMALIQTLEAEAEPFKQQSKNQTAHLAGGNEADQMIIENQLRHISAGVELLKYLEKNLTAVSEKYPGNPAALPQHISLWSLDLDQYIRWLASNPNGMIDRTMLLVPDLGSLPIIGLGLQLMAILLGIILGLQMIWKIMKRINTK